MDDAAHGREALGAIKGMQEVYGTKPAPTSFSVGERVTILEDHQRGVVVEEDAEGGTYLISIHVPGNGRVLKKVHESNLAYF